MPQFSVAALPWAIVSVQILGILSACLVRCSEGCSCQRFFQALFFVALLLVAGAAMVSLRFEPECWLTSGAIMAVMIVVATFQTSRSEKAVAW